MPEQRISGWLEGKEHRFPLRVYYPDTDAGDVVYHATYLDFADRARTEMMRLFGVDHRRLKDEQKLLMAVRSCSVEYLRPARLDDFLMVHSTLVHLGGASLHVAQSIRRGDEELVAMILRLVCMHADEAKAARLPAPLRENLQSYLIQEAGKSHA